MGYSVTGSLSKRRVHSARHFLWFCTFLMVTCAILLSYRRLGSAKLFSGTVLEVPTGSRDKRDLLHYACRSCVARITHFGEGSFVPSICSDLPNRFQGWDTSRSIGKAKYGRISSTAILLVMIAIRASEWHRNLCVLCTTRFSYHYCGAWMVYFPGIVFCDLVRRSIHHLIYVHV